VPGFYNVGAKICYFKIPLPNGLLIHHTGWLGSVSTPDEMKKFVYLLPVGWLSLSGDAGESAGSRVARQREAGCLPAVCTELVT
jgi:hypothetical protein